MKTNTRLLCLLMSLCLLCGLLAGCGGSAASTPEAPVSEAAPVEESAPAESEAPAEEPEGPTSDLEIKRTYTEAEPMPLVDAPVTLTVWDYVVPPVMEVIHDYGTDGHVYAELQKRTGVTLQFTTANLLTASDSMSLMVAANELPDLIYDFLSTGERVQIHQYLYEEHILESELLSGKLDFAVTPVTIENSEIEQIKLMEEIFIVVSQKHPLAEQKYVRLTDFAQDPFLVDEASFDQKIVRVLCGLAGFEPNILLHSNEGELIDDALREGMDVALMPANLIYRKNMRGLQVLRSTDVALLRLLSVAKRRDRILQANAARLYHFAIHYFQNLGKELDSYFGEHFPQKDFRDRKNLGINNLKDEFSSGS